MAGEGYDEAAKRELQEELGINIPLKKVLKLSASPQTGQEFIWLYRGQLRGSGNIRSNRSEIESGAFFAQTIMDGWLAARPKNFAPGFLECWRAFRQREDG
jgi:16S rRNA (adenine1518-N6/adenine1519-N6)-dimethyltransferase